MFRHGNGDGPGPSTYQIHQKMLAIGDDFWIEDGAGRNAFRVDGKAMRLHKTLLLEDPSGRQLYRIQHQLVTIKDTWEVQDEHGTVATVKKALFTPLHERYDVELRGGDEWEVKGKITDHEYSIAGKDRPIATVGKKWFRVRDTYGVQVAPGVEDALVLAVVIVIDQVSHPMK